MKQSVEKRKLKIHLFQPIHSHVIELLSELIETHPIILPRGTGACIRRFKNLDFQMTRDAYSCLAPLDFGVKNGQIKANYSLSDAF